MSLPLDKIALKGPLNTGLAKNFNNQFDTKTTAEMEQILLKSIQESAEQFLAEQLADTLACCDTQITYAHAAAADAYTAAASIYKASGDNNAARQFYKKAGESYTAAGNNSAAAASYAEADNLPSDL